MRIGLALRQPVNLDQLPDQREYLSLAQNLRDQHSLFFIDPRFDQKVYAYRMPGYPAFLALIPAKLPWVLTARIVQILLDLSTIFAIALTAQRAGGSSAVAVTAAALIAINPFYNYFTSLILSETLFAALLAWGIYCFVRRMSWLAVLLLIAACYVRPTGLPLLPALALVAAPANHYKATAYRITSHLRQAVLASAAMFVCLAPWAWRNHNILGVSVWTTTNGGITSYDGFHPGASGGSDQQFVGGMPQLRSMNELQRSEYLAGQARKWIGGHWSEIPALTARKILRGWSPLPLSREFGRPIYRAISVCYELPFDLFCLVGFFSPRLPRQVKMLLTTPAIVVTLAQAITVGSIRYRMPAEAPLALVAAVGLLDIFGMMKAAKKTE